MNNNKYKYKIHDKFYDLTDFVKNHPGGEDIFNKLELSSLIEVFFSILIFLEI